MHKSLRTLMLFIALLCIPQIALCMTPQCDLQLTFTEDEVAYCLSLDPNTTIQPNKLYNFNNKLCTDKAFDNFLTVHNDCFYKCIQSKKNYEYPNLVETFLYKFPQLHTSINPYMDSKDVGLNALMIAARWGKCEIMKRILKNTSQNVEMQASTNDGNTALCEAAKNGHADCVTLLLETGAYPGTTNKRGNYPLSLASGMGHLDAVQAFTRFYEGKWYTQMNMSSNSWLLNLIDQHSRSPLAYAAYIGSVEIVRHLLTCGAIPDLILEPASELRKYPITALSTAFRGKKNSSHLAANFNEIIALLTPPKS